jgi:hypothetical protein
VTRIVKVWLPQLGVCLLLQGGLIGGGLLLNRWIAPSVTPCCVQPQVL